MGNINVLAFTSIANFAINENIVTEDQSVIYFEKTH